MPLRFTLYADHRHGLVTERYRRPRLSLSTPAGWRNSPSMLTTPRMLGKTWRTNTTRRARFVTGLTGAAQ